MRKEYRIKKNKEFQVILKKENLLQIANLLFIH